MEQIKELSDIKSVDDKVDKTIVLDDKVDESNMLDDITSIDDINSNTSLDDISSSEANISDSELNKTQAFVEAETLSTDITTILIGNASTIIKDEPLNETIEMVNGIINDSIELAYDLKKEEELTINDDEDDDLLQRLEAADANTTESVESNDLTLENDSTINETVDKIDVSMGEMTSFLKTCDDDKDPLQQTLVAKTFENEVVDCTLDDTLDETLGNTKDVESLDETEDVEPPSKKKCDEDIRKSVDDTFNNDSSSSLIETTENLNSVNSIRKSIEEDDTIRALTKEIEESANYESMIDDTIKTLTKEIEEAVKEVNGVYSELETTVEEESLPEKSVEDKPVEKKSDEEESVEKLAEEEFVKEKSAEEPVEEKSVAESVPETTEDLVAAVDQVTEADSTRKSVDEMIKEGSIRKSVEDVVSQSSLLEESSEPQIQDDDDDVCIVERG